MRNEVTALIKFLGDPSGAMGAIRQVRGGVKGVSDGMRSLSTAISGVAIAAGLTKVVDFTKQVVDFAIQATGAMQNLEVALTGLAARELVRTGQFDNLSDAMETARGMAAELTEELRKIALASPFAAQQVFTMYRVLLGFGAGAEAAVGLTAAILDTAAGLGLTNEQLDRMSYNLAQALIAGDLSAANLRQLKMVGLDLADVFRNELGLSVEQVRAGLQSGALTLKDVSDAFTNYAAVNFGNAAERMAKTLQGLESSFNDLFTLAAADVLGPLLDKVTAALAALFDKLSGILESGAFKAIGEFLATPPGIAIIGVLGAIVAGIVGIGGALSGVLVLVPAISAVVSALGAVAPVIAVLLPIFAAAAAALAGLVAAGFILYQAWVENWGGIRTAIEEAWASIAPKLEELLGLAQAWGAEILAQVGELWAAVKTQLEPLFARLAAIIGAIDWGSLFSTLRDALNVAGGWIAAWIETLTRLLSGEGVAAFDSMEDAAIDALTMIALVFQKYIRPAFTWGYNLIANFAQGLWDAAQQVLVAVMNAIGNLIGGFLAPGSPPRRGPLAGIVKWGQGIIETFLRAFGLADFGLLREALAPVRDALQDAVSAGDITEAESLQIFGSVRKQVAALIADFRKTGEISEEALGRIGEALGAGGEELVKYLRLQLEHQKALDNLKKVQAEVAEAEAAGFVPAALKAKLKAAQDEAKAAEEQVDWQKEFLAVQQESVDLQLRLVEALERLAKAGGGRRGGGGAGAGALGAGLGGGLGGAGWTPEIEPIDVSAIFGEMSPEFQKMREQVEAFIRGLQTWLNLPLGEKIASVVAFIQEQWAKLEPILREKWEAIKAAALEKWEEIKAAFQEKVTEISTAVSQKIEEVRAVLADAWNQALDEVKGAIAQKWEEIKAGILGYLYSLFDEMGLNLDTMVARWAAIWEDVKLIAWTVWTRVVSAITEKVEEVRQAVEQKVQEIRDWWEPKWTEFKETVSTILGEVVSVVTERVQEVYDAVAAKVEEVLTWIGDQVLRFVSVGEAIIDGIKRGVLNKTGELIEAATGAVEDALQAAKNLLGISSPSKVAAEMIGEPFIAGITAGMLGQVRNATKGVAQVMAAMTRGALPAARGARVGGVNIEHQQFGDLLFPNVRDGRDVVDIRRQLSRRTLEGIMAGRTG